MNTHIICLGVLVLCAWNASGNKTIEVLSMANHHTSLTFRQIPWSERAAYRHLPVALTPLIGREREVDMLCDLLTRSQVRLLTLLGPGGVGKTRLGLHVALQMQQHFSDGVYFVPLAMVREPSLVVPALAQALHLQESGELPLLEQVQSKLQDKHTLLLLDNFEHVVQTAPLLEDLLMACPSLKILATSRDVLHLRMEQQFPVAPFPLPEHANAEELSNNPAVALFLERAQAIMPTFQLTPANARAVADICISLDGLPLALELAAARVKALPPLALLSRLNQRLHLLTSGPRTLPERQQTLRNTLKWSYDLLSSQEQWLYRLLSVFVGGCTLQAIETVAATLTGKHESLLDTVTALIDKNLLVRSEQEGDEPRFAMLETIREYGLECLREYGESETSQQTHANYYLQLCEQAEAHLKGAGQQSWWLKRLTQDQANLRATLSWLLERRDTQKLLQLSGALWWYWTIRGMRNEAIEWLQIVLQLPGAEAPTAARARALCSEGFLIVYRYNRGREGLALLEESLALYERLGDYHGLAETLGWAAQVQIYLKDYHAARGLAERGMVLGAAVGERRFVALNHSMLSIVIEKQGNEAEALAFWQDALAMALELEEHAGLATRARRHLASLALTRGDYIQARTLMEENLLLAREAGYIGTISSSLASLAELARIENDYAQANALCSEGLLMTRQTGDRYVISRLLCTQGNIALAHSDEEQAIASYSESLSLAIPINAREIAGHCLLGLAKESLGGGEFQQATSLFAAAIEHLADGHPLSPIEQAANERDLAALHTQIDSETFADVWAQGKSITLQQALAFARTRQQKLRSSPRKQVESAPESNHPRISRYPDKLTAREVEVLRLLAQGMTDAQIAERLVISTRTVNAHLTSIYRKMRVSSRHAAAHYALTQHLI